MTIQDFFIRAVSKILRRDYIRIRKIVKDQTIHKRKKTIYLLQTPAHSNIGDHAIAEAEVLFLQPLKKDYNIVEINQSYHYLFLRYYKDKINDKDIILLHGGGNLGNEYIREENIRRSTVESFPKNKIVLLPQTVYYSNNDSGNTELLTTQKIFAKHNNLTLIAREAKSFDKMKGYFPNNTVLLTPDIVLSMTQIKRDSKRKGILMVMRNDEERIINEEQAIQLDLLANNNSGKVTYSDMHYHKGVNDTVERKAMLEWKFNQFSTAELVITDRLHGMVFAAITGTPCIAFSNYNQKVSGTYEWIKDLKYIRFLETAESCIVENNIRELMTLKDFGCYQPDVYGDYFDKIKELL